MPSTVEEVVATARGAVAAHRWGEAYDDLKELDRSSLLPDALEDLAEAAWWSGDLDTCIDARERAFAARRSAGNSCRAGMLALELAKNHFWRGSPSMGMGWLNRARRLLADTPECRERGHLERALGVVALEGEGDLDRALDHAARALEIAERFGDIDLQALAIHDQGRTLVAKGEVKRGWELMDEATTAAVAGELSPMTTGLVYCNTIALCEHLADYGRAGEWSEAAKNWCERQSIAGFPGLCRVHRATVMRLRGAWAEAEHEARRACDELRTFNVEAAGAAFYEIGEIRLRAGDLAAAEEAFRDAHELGKDPQPGLALLRLAQSRVDAAVACIKRSLTGASQELLRAHRLPAAVEIALATADVEWAREAATELQAIAEAYGSTALQAAAACARGAVALAEGDSASAIELLSTGRRLWQEVLDAPYEAAQARLVLADAYEAQGDRDGAALERDAARAALERLGAATDAARPSTLTAFMFTDIVSSTSLVEAMGDEAWATLLRWHDETLRGLFAACDGHVANHTGDGFFVAFDDVLAAIDCAVAVQRTLAEHRREHGFATHVRIGVHAGSGTRSGRNYHGKDVHEAARIAAVAVAGEILVSRTALPDSRLRYGVSEPRSVDLKGVSEPVEVVEIAWR